MDGWKGGVLGQHQTRAPQTRPPPDQAPPDQGPPDQGCSNTKTDLPFQYTASREGALPWLMPRVGVFDWEEGRTERGWSDTRQVWFVFQPRNNFTIWRGFLFII